MPYDHKNTTPDGVPSQKMKSLLEELNQLHCQKRCMIGSGGGSVGLVTNLFRIIVVFMNSLLALACYSFFVFNIVYNTMWFLQ